MRKYATHALVAVLMLAAILLPPWLAWKEAAAQAFDIESGQTLAYAHDVLHRTDATTAQAARSLRELSESPYPPCSDASLRLMRSMDLGNSYLQAVGYVRNGVMVCSSLGRDPIPLGGDSYLTSRGYRIYSNVPFEGLSPTPLLALEGNGFAALVHRDLPIDTSLLQPDISLGLYHLERKQISISRGFIDPAWMPHLGKQVETSFIAGPYLVTIARSSQRLVAAIAATPLKHVEERTMAIAWRLVPAAALGGALIAALVYMAWRGQMSIGTALRLALRRGELFLVYQPIVDLATGEVVGVEALLRWQRANGEEIAPDLFIPVAERSGLSAALTDHVLHLIAHDTDGYLGRHPDFHVAINLSATDFHTADIVGKIERLIERCGARPSNFILEITERSLLDFQAAMPVLQAIRERAIAVAIDDFGTGYSSLHYLESLHVDYLKIDRSFIEAIGTGASTSQVVGHIIEMARTMHLRVIAEGIESEAQAEFLRARNVQFAQGWNFGKPMHFADVVRQLHEGSHALRMRRAALP